MKRSYLTNLLLLTLMMVLLWQLDRVQQQPDITTIGGTLETAMVQKITVQRAEQNNIELVRNHAGWQLTQPFAARASDSRINMLLSLLDTLPGEQFVIDNDLDLAAFGLAEPDLKLLFNDTAFTFGDIEPLSEQRYLRAGNVIYLFNDSISPLLQASASGFIENRLFAGVGQLQAINIPMRSGQTLKNQSLSMQLTNGQWQSDVNAFTTDTLTATAQAWQQAYAMQVSPSSTKLTDDFLPIQFTFADQQTIAAYARLSAQGLSVLVPDWQLQYQFPASTAANLFPALPADSEAD